jgi:hypothetical protein
LRTLDSGHYPILDAAEEVFDFVPPPIEAPGAIDFPGGVASVGDDKQGPFISDLLAHFLAVVIKILHS